MITNVKNYCDSLLNEFDKISPERKTLLEEISNYIRKKKSENKEINLIYICTHNSRRSHFGQVWAHVAADYFNIEQVHAFSGGTEVTAFNPNAIDALKRIGFKVIKTSETDNPIYEVYHNENDIPAVCFSKTFDSEHNPQNKFAAIMTCSEAEENCPFIPGVDIRIGTTYEDPKMADNTPEQNKVYDERCRQIARETFYAFSKV